MAELGLTLKGTQELRAALAALRGRAVQASKRALHEVHEEIMTEAKVRTPVLTGALRASGMVHQPEERGGLIVSQGSFGGPAVDYAVHVHERLDLHHTNGQAKFYESALLEKAPNIEQELADKLRRELERGPAR